VNPLNTVPEDCELDSDVENHESGLDDFFDTLGPDPETGEPRVEIIMDILVSKTFDASDYLKGLLLRMGLSCRIATTIRDDSVHLNIIGAEQGLIIGHRGQNLDALQHLVNRMVNKNSEEMVPVTVDSDGYRDRRYQQLELMVHAISSEVTASNKPIITDPLTPSERRLFHIAASRIKGIRTSSFGDGFFQPIRVFTSDESFN